jgi:DNA-binding transcriptional ArsR family regulator/uncharacterized protein YndB with AHSA1/START domain
VIEPARNTQRVLDALNSPVRREILWLIWERELPAGEIAATFHLTGATISEHLAVLRAAGLITLRKEGTFRRYRTRQLAVEGMQGLLGEDVDKWFPGITPARLAAAKTMGAVAVTVNATCSQGDAFRAFTDPSLYSRWVGVPVALDDGFFAATMEWGLEVRGTYDHVIEPSLIVMSWDFEAGNVPVPGRGARAYLDISPRGRGCRLELTQLIRSAEHGPYMERAWGLILGRFRDHIRMALDPDKAARLRPKRPRSTSSR